MNVSRTQTSRCFRHSDVRGFYVSSYKIRLLFTRYFYFAHKTRKCQVCRKQRKIKFWKIAGKNVSHKAEMPLWEWR